MPPPPLPRLFFVGGRSAAAVLSSALQACFVGGAMSSSSSSSQSSHSSRKRPADPRTQDHRGASLATSPCIRTTTDVDVYDDDYDAETSRGRRRRRQSQQRRRRRRYRPLAIVLAGPTASGKSDVAAVLCSPLVASAVSRGHRLASGGEEEMEEDEYEDIDEDEHEDGGGTKGEDDVVDLAEEEDDDEAGRRRGRVVGRRDRAVVARGHVVSADSVQVYRGADVGSNKPTRIELGITPHHLIDVVDLLESSPSSPPSPAPSSSSSYNAADWMDDARYVIRRLAPIDDCFDMHRGEEEDDDDEDDVDEATVRRRGRIDETLRRSLAQSSSSSSSVEIDEPPSAVLPVIVGGTMMYLQWLVRGMPDAVRPTECAARRAAGAIDAFRSRRRVDDDDRGSEDGTAAGISAGSGGDDDDAATTEAEAEAEDVASWEVASAHVSSLGPLFARRVRKLPGRDWYRLRRLLEVAYTTSSSKIGHSNDGDGEGVRSEEEREREILRDLTEGEVYTGLRSGSLSDLGYDVRCFFLCPSDRMTHFHVVDERCERMLMSGLLRETADLCVSGALSDESQVTAPSDTGRRCNTWKGRT